MSPFGVSPGNTATYPCIPPGAQGRSGADDRPRSGAAAGGGMSGAFRGGRSSADVRVHRTSSDEAKTPSEAAEPGRKAEMGSSGIGSKQAQGRERLPPACRDPFLKRPCTKRVDAPLPARRPTEAYPPRYGEGGQRSRGGCSSPRMPGSEGMDLCRPVSPGPRDPALVSGRTTAAPGTGHRLDCRSELRDAVLRMRTAPRGRS
jgi:hypothetical protein